MTLREAAQRIAALETLLEYLHEAFGAQPWTAADCFEVAAENGLVFEALAQCLGREFTVVKFSRFLHLNCGRWGEFGLRRTKRHSRDGAVFCVTKLGQSVTTTPRRNASVPTIDSL
jgi:hypothetical protein